MELGKINTNFIHPTAVVDTDVVLGSNNYIGPFCYITGKTTIGDNNRFEAYCSIGTPPEHIGHFDKTDGRVSIGNDNIFREQTKIQSGATRCTHIGNYIKMLCGVYIAHDSIIGDNTLLSANVIIAGYSILMPGVHFGIGSMCHQFSVVGAYSMIGMGSVITKKTEIKPGGVYIGSPARYFKSNEIGLQKSKIDIRELDTFNKQYLELCNENKLHSKYN